MTRLIYYTATTLDGFIADPDDSLDWLMRQDQDEQGPLNYEDFIKDIGAIVMAARPTTGCGPTSPTSGTTRCRPG